MRPQTFAVVLLALVSGLAAVWGVRSLMNRRPAAAVVEEKVAVAFALEELPQDEPIDAKTKVEVRQVPRSQAPEGALASAEDAEGRYAAIPMLKGEPVVEAKLLPKGQKPATYPVVYALKDLAAGVPVEPAWVEVRDVPRSKAPEGFLASAEDAASRAPAAAIPKGDPVVEAKLLPKESRPNLALLVPPGMRAFTVQTPKFSPSVAGLMRPGNHVDVLLTAAPGGAGQDKGDAGAASGTEVSKVLVQNVELLDVHANAQPKDDLDGTNSVTLLVTPRQASILNLARQRGTFELTLRKDGDAAAGDETTVSVDDLGLDDVPTVVALKDLPPGRPIAPGDVAIRMVPRAQAPASRISSIKDAVGRLADVGILKGEFVVELKLLPKRARPDLAALVSPDMRTFTFQTPEFSPTLAGLMRTGNRVDVLATIGMPGTGAEAKVAGGAAKDAGKGDPRTASVTVVQDVKLLDVHANTKPQDDLEGTNSVTLLVTPHQRALLNLAREHGELRLSLRNDAARVGGDQDGPGGAQAEKDTATFDELLGDLAPPPAPIAIAPEPEPKPEVLTIRTLRGTIVGSDRITIAPGAGGAAKPNPGAGFQAKVIEVVDGDTIVALDPNGREVKIRVFGIDAPESKQEFGAAAKGAASGLALGQTVSARKRDVDQFGRTVAEVILPGGRSLGEEMVRSGFAWWYRHYAPDDATLQRLETEARAVRRGLWAGPNPVPPWEWRKAH